jgi:hypothetical protein
MNKILFVVFGVKYSYHFEEWNFYHLEMKCSFQIVPDKLPDGYQ